MLISDEVLAAIKLRQRKRIADREGITAAPWEVSGQYRVTGPAAGAYPGASDTVVRARAKQEYRNAAEDAANIRFVAAARNDPVIDDVEILLAIVDRLRDQLRVQG